MLVTIAAALALASAAPAEPAAAEASPQAEQLVGKKDKLICENSQATGTRMPKRKCRTKEEIQRHPEASRQKLDNIATRQQKGIGNGPPVSP